MRKKSGLALITVGAAVFMTIGTGTQALGQQATPPGQAPADRPGRGADDNATTFLAATTGLDRATAAKRIQRQEDVIDFVDDVRQQIGAKFAGSFHRQTADGHVVIYSTDDAVDLAAAARAHGLQGMVHVQKARHGQQVLLRTYDTLVADLATAEPASTLGIEVHTIGNQVVIQRPLDVAQTDAETDFIARSVRDHPEVVVVRDQQNAAKRLSCDFSLCPPPARGGTKIRATVSGQSKLCSFGFTVRSKNDHKPYILTAAHCPAGTSATWDNGNAIYGITHSQALFGNYDTALISYRHGVNDTSTFWTPENWVLVAESYNNTSGGTYNTVRNEQYNIYSYLYNYQMLGTVGQIVCKTGITKGTNCGQNLDYPTSHVGTGYLMKNSACSRDGDSGGPYYVGNKAHGIVVSGSYSNQTTCQSGDTTYFGNAANYAEYLGTYIALS